MLGSNLLLTRGQRKERKVERTGKSIYRGNKDKITLAKNVLYICYVPGMGHNTLYILILLIPTTIIEAGTVIHISQRSEVQRC